MYSLENEFCYKPNETKEGIEWILEMSPYDLLFHEKTEANFLENIGMFKGPQYEIQLPFSGSEVQKLINDKLFEGKIPPNYTKLSYTPPKVGPNADKISAFLNLNTNDIITQSKQEIYEKIKTLYGNHKVEIGLLRYNTVPGKVNLSNVIEPISISLESGNIPWNVDGIPFYFESPKVTQYLDVDNLHATCTVDLLPLNVNMYIKLKGKNSSPKTAYDAFDASEMTELRKKIGIKPFIDLLGNKRILDEEPYNCNDSGGLYVHMSTGREHLADTTELINKTLMPEIKRHNLTIEYSDKKPEHPNVADRAIIMQITNRAQKAH